MSNYSATNTDYSTLLTFTKAVFIAYGFSENHAQIASKNLCLADLRGIDSHGVARLPGYCRLIASLRINANPSFNWTSDRLAVANLDADKAIGLVAATYGMNKALEKAQTCGSAVIGIHNSNHFGIGAAHVEAAARKGLISWASTNASPLVAPYGSQKRLFGTNPICIAFPNPLFKNGDPIIIDMATSAAANGKLEIAARTNQPIPTGWAIDKLGNPSQDPHVLKNGGALLPLGSDPAHGVHKGYGLNAMVDLLTGVLTGASFGEWVPPFVPFLEPHINQPGKGIGHIVGVIDPAAFGDIGQYFERMKQWAIMVKNAPTLDPNNPILLHGEQEFMEEKKRLQYGISLNKDVKNALLSLSSQHQIPLEFN
jgi:LDH2 family malate/lactate/ureidoglycolate dehydrogenase